MIVDLFSVILVRAAWQLIPGLMLREFFNLLTGDAPVSIGIWGILALVIATFFGRVLGAYGFYYADVPLFADMLPCAGTCSNNPAPAGGVPAA
jgi:hypothetical protein